MSLTYKFDRLGEGQNDKDALGDIERFDGAASVRNVAFVNKDGVRIFLNYAYLIAAEYKPEDSELRLFFSSHIVSMKGRNLDALFEEFKNHGPKTVACGDERYAAMEEDDKIYITNIDIKINA